MGDLYLLRKALRDLLAIRRLAPILALAALPAAIALLWRSLVDADRFVPAEVYDALFLLLVLGFILVLPACVFGTSVVTQETEQKTIVYLLTRPIPRWRILLVRSAAAFLATTAAAMLAAILLAFAAGGPAHLRQSPLGRDLLILPLAALAYGGLFLLLGTLLRRPLLVGLLYTFGVESWLPNLPGNFKLLSLMAYLRVLAPHGHWDTGKALVASTTITPALAWWVVIGVAACSLAGGLLAFSRHEYVPRDDD